jgi:molybdenum cofactor cytidylyltransferase
VIAAIVPACGRSTRIGRPKLLLPIAGAPLIARVVAALRGGGVDEVLVVVPPATVEGASELAEAAGRAGATIVVAPGPTPDMRATFEVGLAWLESEGRAPPDAVLLQPGDSPGLNSDVVAAVIVAHRGAPEAIHVPIHEGHRGHPLALPWPLARAVRDLPDGCGINAVLAAHADRVRPCPVGEAGMLHDLDTWDDYRSWASGGGGASGG